MLAKELEIIVYPDAGSEWHWEVTTDPTWSDIEAAVRRLDRAAHPFLRLYLPRPDRESVLWVLEVIGGGGEYGLSAADGRGWERWWLRDPGRPVGPELIEIWVTGQGAAFEETYLCNDLAVVLRVCKRFAQEGKLDTGVVWEERSAEPDVGPDRGGR